MRDKVVIAFSGVVAGAVLMAGCSGGPGGRFSPAAMPSRVSTTSSTTPTTSPTGRPTATASPTSDARLVRALLAVAEKSRVLKSDQTASARKGVAVGLGAARQGLAATRTAAYKTATRDCAVVRSAAHSAQSGASDAGSQAAALDSWAASRQNRLDDLRAAIGPLQQLASKGSVSTASSPSPAEVAAALKAAQNQLFAESASLKATQDTAANDLAEARRMAATALEIYGKVC